MHGEEQEREGGLWADRQRPWYVLTSTSQVATRKERAKVGGKKVEDAMAQGLVALGLF